MQLDGQLNEVSDIAGGERKAVFNGRRGDQAVRDFDGNTAQFRRGVDDTHCSAMACVTGRMWPWKAGVSDCSSHRSRSARRLPVGSKAKPGRSSPMVMTLKYSDAADCAVNQLRTVSSGRLWVSSDGTLVLSRKPFTDRPAAT
jgi:hypothetical protein